MQALLLLLFFFLLLLLPVLLLLLLLLIYRGTWYLLPLAVVRAGREKELVS